MNRSTSYFATASAIRSGPSMLTSSRLKFLLELVCNGIEGSCSLILSWIIPSNQIVNDIGMSNALFERWCVSQIVFLFMTVQLASSTADFNLLVP